jgi:SM-20-related protein
MNVSSPILADDTPGLNPALDASALAESFRSKGRIHIPNILNEAAARRTYKALDRETPWSLTFNEGEKHFDFDQVSPHEKQQKAYAAWTRARDEFQFFHHRHRLTTAGEPYKDPAHYYAKFVPFLSSPELLNFVRAVTGAPQIAWVNAMATLYKPFDFLTAHDDDVKGDNRVIAYVFNFTLVWRPDWGGALQFLDEHGNIEEGYIPSFNALNLFRVPKRHAVAQIAPFGGHRYAITGWFHHGEPHKGAAEY